MNLLQRIFHRHDFKVVNRFNHEMRNGIVSKCDCGMWKHEFDNRWGERRTILRKP